MAEKTSTFRINYSFQGQRNQLRTGSLVVHAPDLKSALDTVKKQLDGEHDWYKITSTSQYPGG